MKYYSPHVTKCLRTDRFLWKSLIVLTGYFLSQIPRPFPNADVAGATKNEEDMTVAMVTGLASLTSRTSMGLMIVVGIVSMKDNKYFSMYKKKFVTFLKTLLCGFHILFFQT